MISQVTKFFTDLWTCFESEAERRKFVLLAGIFSLIIGVYWTLRPIKDAVFLTVVGKDYLPKAKLLSMFVVIPCVLIYSILVDKFPRHKLLYGLTIFYAIFGLIFAFLILNPVTGIENTVSSPWRLMGWAWYIYVESFGSIMIAGIFWSFVGDTTSPDEAKRGYPLIATGGQLGGVVGPIISGFLVEIYKKTGWAVVWVVFLLLVMIALVYYFISTTPKSQLAGFGGEKNKPLEGAKDDKAKPGFFDGLKLITTKPYMFGIFIFVSTYEIVNTVFDYYFKVAVDAVYKTGDAKTLYLLKYAAMQNGVAVLLLIFGISKIAKRFGLSKILLILPAIMAVCGFWIYNNPVLQTIFIVMMITKGVNYALNQPTKEQLYIPTSKEAKYKGKAWIDMFGSRFSKGIGSLISDTRNNMFANNPHLFMMFSLCSCLGFIGVWLYAALFIGRVHAQAVKENRVAC